VNTRIKLALAVAVAGATAVGGTAALAGGGGGKQVRGSMTGYQEVPAVSTAANGTFQARVSPAGDEIAYKLSYTGLEGNVTQAHIHFGQRGVNGGISAWLCSNLGPPNTPPGTQACPPPPATIEGTIKAADIVGPSGQGIAGGELGELLRAIRAGVAYANVHSATFPAGEIRTQLRGGWGRGGSKGGDR
jgi:hypothetical protein